MSKTYSVDCMGVLAWEIEIGSHIKNRILFVVADNDLKNMAWYVFSEEMLNQNWDSEFDQVAQNASDKQFLKKVGFNTLTWGGVSPIGRRAKSGVPYDKFAIPLGKGVGNWAHCLIRNDDTLRMIDVSMNVASPRTKNESLYFRLKKVDDRRTLDLLDDSGLTLEGRGGRVFLVGVEPYSNGALYRSIGVTPQVAPVSPFEPNF